MTEKFSMCIGYEILPSLHAEAVNNINKAMAFKLPTLTCFELNNLDMWNCETRTFPNKCVIFANTTLFSPEMITRLRDFYLSLPNAILI